ncbi:MAG: ribosome maturation factor RimM [Nitrospinales bacterium]
MSRYSLVAIGRVTKTHGLKGELKFYPSVSNPEMIRGVHNLKLGTSENETTEYQVESLRGSGSSLIIKFEHCDSIEQAKSLAGLTLYMAPEYLPKLPEGEYYGFEIEGLEVYDEEGSFYGRITEIIETGSNDVYVVQDGEKELLLPVIDSVVKSVDLEKNNRGSALAKLCGSISSQFFPRCLTPPSVKA